MPKEFVQQTLRIDKSLRDRIEQERETRKIRTINDTIVRLLEEATANSHEVELDDRNHTPGGDL